jgi:protein required for attachment to host cells
MTRLTSSTWLLVADGSRALILRNEGSAMEPRLAAERAYTIDNPPSRDQGTERPGRTNDAFGRRSAMEVPDWHQVAEDRFMERLSADLEQDRRAQRFEHLVIVAPPVALGVLRSALSGHLKQAVVAEIDKDLTKMPLSQIASAVSKALGS